MDLTEAFEAQRPRLVALAARVLTDAREAEDVVQQAWMRLAATDAVIETLPAWLTTVTTRLCLDRLRARTPVPTDEVDGVGAVSDPADEAVLASSVGVALHAVLDRLSPDERVAFVLHDSFAVEFSVVAAVLDTSPAAARKLASRARAKLASAPVDGSAAPWQVVDAFMAAARQGDFYRLVQALAPDARVAADDAARAAGTPQAIEGRRAMAEFFDGSAHAALPVFVDGRPAVAWFLRGEPRVVFDFEVVDGAVHAIVFRADPSVLDQVVRRDGPVARA